MAEVTAAAEEPCSCVCCVCRHQGCAPDPSTLAGSVKEGASRDPKYDYGEDEELHVLITGDRQEDVCAACAGPLPHQHAKLALHLRWFNLMPPHAVPTLASLAADGRQATR